MVLESLKHLAAKYMFDLSVCNSNIDKKSAAFLRIFVRTGDMAIIYASQLTKMVTSGKQKILKINPQISP